jgi:hypothetical protein
MEMMAHSAMQEYNSSSKVQDYGSVPAETSVFIDGASRLLRLGRLAQELGADPVAEQVVELAARVFEGRLYVACVGQFKRGKSTLLNALVGEEVVPTGFIPVTAVPTVIRFGDKLHARVRMSESSAAISRPICCPDISFSGFVILPPFGEAEHRAARANSIRPICGLREQALGARGKWR